MRKLAALCSVVPPRAFALATSPSDLCLTLISRFIRLIDRSLACLRADNNSRGSTGTLRAKRVVMPHDAPTTELVDEVGGVWFEVWIPKTSRHARVSSHEVLVGFESGKQSLQMVISLAHDLPIEWEVGQWRTTGALVLR